MDQIIGALKGTPWWVYVLFAYLIFRGIKALKSSVVSLKKIFILPLLFLAWSIYRLYEQFSGFSDVFYWFCFFIIGCIVGWKLAVRFRVRADKKKKLIKIPGTPLLLILVLFVFAIKYFFGYYYATHAVIDPVILLLNILTTGFISGIFFGRALCFINKFARAHHEKLKETK